MKSNQYIIKGGSDIDFSQFKDFYKLETKLNINDEANEDFIKTEDEFLKEFLDTYYLHFSILCVKSFNKLKIDISTDPIQKQIIDFIPKIKKFVNFIVLYNIFVFYFKNLDDKIKDLIISLGDFDGSKQELQILNYIKNSIKNKKDLSSLQLLNKLNNKFDSDTINKLKEFATPVHVIVGNDDEVPPPPPPVGSAAAVGEGGPGDLGAPDGAVSDGSAPGPGAVARDDGEGAVGDDGGIPPPHPPAGVGVGAEGDDGAEGGPDDGPVSSAAAVAAVGAVGGPVVGDLDGPVSSDVYGPDPAHIPVRLPSPEELIDDAERLDDELLAAASRGGKKKLLGGNFDDSNRYVEVKKRGTDDYYLYDPNYIIPIIERQDPNFRHDENNLIIKKKEISKFDKKIIIVVTYNNNYYININDEMFNNDYFQSSPLYHKLNFVPKNPNFDINQIRGGGEIENNQLNYLKISLLNDFFLANEIYLYKIINKIYKFYI